MPELLAEYPPLLKVTDVAEIMSCTTKTVRNLVDRGNLKAIYPTPRMMRITRTSLEAHLAKCAA